MAPPKDIVVETINVLISTNIPDQANISLTSKLLITDSINAKLYNEYPYITSSFAIREGYLINKPYNDILDYFFIKDRFIRYTSTMMEDEKAEPKTTREEETDCIKANIKTMLRMIFNTFPINGNVTSTLEPGYIDKLYNINKYSYLMINSKKYTIAKVVWINDIYNHYVTKQLVKDFKAFNAWKTNELRSIQNRTSYIKIIKEVIIKAWKEL